MSGSLFDDNDLSTVPSGEFVPHHYLAIPAVRRLPPGDPGVGGAIAQWLADNEPSPTMIWSLHDGGFADLLHDRADG